jgi:hypothetical protein
MNAKVKYPRKETYQEFSDSEEEEQDEVYNLSEEEAGKS